MSSIPLRHTALFKHAPLGIFIVDVHPDGQMRMGPINPAMSHILGIPHEEVSEERIRQKLSPVKIEQIRAKLEECIANKQALEYESPDSSSSSEIFTATIMVPLLGKTGQVDRVVPSCATLPKSARPSPRSRNRSCDSAAFSTRARTASS